MKWQPIETYDALPALLKPKRAVFFFKQHGPSRRGEIVLGATVQTTRTFGLRECTHWCALPDDPKPDAFVADHATDPRFAALEASRP